MDHQEFIKIYNNKSRNIIVNRPKALHALSQGLLPKNYQYAHLFWTCVWLLSYAAGILIMIFQTWWIGLIFLVFIPQMLSKATKKSAMDFIVKHALENNDFYQYAITESIITIE